MIRTGEELPIFEIGSCLAIALFVGVHGVPQIIAGADNGEEG